MRQLLSHGRSALSAHAGTTGRASVRYEECGKAYDGADAAVQPRAAGTGLTEAPLSGVRVHSRIDQVNRRHPAARSRHDAGHP